MTANVAERRPPILALISSQAFSLHNFRGPLIHALVERGVRVVALAPDFDDASRSAVSATGALPVDVSLSRAAINPIVDLADTIRLTLCLRRLKPDITFAYFIKPVIYGTLAAVLARVPRRYALVPGLGYVFNEAEAGSSIRRRALRSVVARMYQVAFACCDQVIFQNDEDAGWFLSRRMISPEKVVRICGTGVDLTQWPPMQLTKWPPVFLLVARLLREKGIVDYVEAAKLVRARHPEARFILVGGLDPNPSGLKLAEVTAWVDAGIIEWAGNVSDVRPWMRRANVYVLPSYYGEGVPRSTQEAMAAGRPIITTDSVGCRDTVVDGVNGFLVPVRDHAALARAMERFIEKPELIMSMGRESRRLAEERYDVNSINAQTLEVLGVTVAHE